MSSILGAKIVIFKMFKTSKVTIFAPKISYNLVTFIFGVKIRSSNNFQAKIGSLFYFLVMACLLSFSFFIFSFKRKWNFNHPLFYTYPPPLLHRNNSMLDHDVQDLDDTSRITQFTLKPDFYPYFNFEERDFYFEDF